MSWPFVGRTEQLDRIHRVFAEPRPGPVLIVGTPGMGRTRLLAEALVTAPLSPGDTVLHLESTGPGPFAALRPLLPTGYTVTSASDLGVAEVAEEVTRTLGGRRPVIMFDDAHLADQQSMQVLRHLRRTHDALLLVTAVGTGALPHGPDPLDFLRYEPGTRTMRLPPLSTDEVARILAEILGGPVRAATTSALHATTGGNPALLHDLVVGGRLTDRMVVHDGMFQLAATPVAQEPTDRFFSADPDAPVNRTLIEAVDEAWRELALDRVDELCRLASWRGLTGAVASTWASALLLRGRVADGMRVLDAYTPATRPLNSPRLPVTRAMLVGLGQRRVADAEALLVDAARTDVQHRERLLACRAWLLAVAGSPTEAAAALTAVIPDADREATVFCRATHAAVALATGQAHEAVSHLRRALAAADGLRAELPWFPPYLTACLIDALLLAGRISEATAESANFHACHRGCGWNVAVAFDALLATRRSAPARQVLRYPG
jgi:hypothetical protein